MDALKQAENLAKERHVGQIYIIDGQDCPYFEHLVMVKDIVSKYSCINKDKKAKLEIIALLHDILEDTDTQLDELKFQFGEYIANAVKSLTKDNSLPYEQRLMDSLQRVNIIDRDLGIVKMADRICNLLEIPPHWNEEKINHYLEDAKLIYNTFKDTDEKIAKILKNKIDNYKRRK